mgnify:CR=1 FL=1
MLVLNKQFHQKSKRYERNITVKYAALSFSLSLSHSLHITYHTTSNPHFAYIKKNFFYPKKNNISNIMNKKEKREMEKKIHSDGCSCVLWLCAVLCDGILWVSEMLTFRSHRNFLLFLLLSYSLWIQSGFKELRNSLNLFFPLNFWVLK